MVLAAQRVNDYLNEHLGSRRLTDVRPDDIRSYRLSLERAGLAPLTVTHILSDARCFLRWCEEGGTVSRSPFPRRVMPRIPEVQPDRLSDAETLLVLGIPEPQAFVIRLALSTGMRWGELCRSDSSHVADGMLVLSQTKSGRIRRVPLSNRMLAETAERPGRLVPYAVCSPGSFAKFVRHHSGVRRFHVHQLRHTFACRWLERGGGLPALQQILGHASITTTQRYARLSDVHVRREAEQVGAIFGGW